MISSVVLLLSTQPTDLPAGSLMAQNDRIHSHDNHDR